jgi:hypothetical protein
MTSVSAVHAEMVETAMGFLGFGKRSAASLLSTRIVVERSVIVDIVVWSVREVGTGRCSGGNGSRASRREASSTHAIDLHRNNSGGSGSNGRGKVGERIRLIVAAITVRTIRTFHIANTGAIVDRNSLVDEIVERGKGSVEGSDGIFDVVSEAFLEEKAKYFVVPTEGSGEAAEIGGVDGGGRGHPQLHKLTRVRCFDIWITPSGEKLFGEEAPIVEPLAIFVGSGLWILIASKIGGM